jgi:hypothetical protein
MLAKIAAFDKTGLCLTSLLGLIDKQVNKFMFFLECPPLVSTCMVC